MKQNRAGRATSLMQNAGARFLALNRRAHDPFRKGEHFKQRLSSVHVPSSGFVIPVTYWLVETQCFIEGKAFFAAT